MSTLIGVLLANFPLTALGLAIVAAGVALVLRAGPLARGAVAEELLRWFCFFAVGVYYFYNFVVHVFFGEMAARFIGWQQSPFQAEVGFASLGFAVVGLLAFRGGWGLRAAAIVGPACFLWGAAAGHVYQLLTTHNTAPGNAGTVLYTDVALPIVGFALLWWRYGKSSE